MSILKTTWQALSLLVTLIIGGHATSMGVSVEVSPVVHAGATFSVGLALPPSLALKKGTIEAEAWSVDDQGGTTHLVKEKLTVSSRDTLYLQHRLDGLVLSEVGRSKLRIRVGTDMQDVSVTCVPGWLTLLPPLVTLAISIIHQQVIIALLVGIWSGSVLVSGFDPLIAFLRTFDRYFVGAFTGEGNAEVLLFTFLLGGTIGLVQKSGGAQGLANELKRFMGTRTQGQLCTVALGCLIFFDDYSSILIVGNSLRDVVRAVGVSPAKFSWLVHSMGVVLASLSPISSWVGLQIGYTKAVLESLGVSSVDGFVVVLRSIPFRFFPLFYLLLILVILVSRRDFGPMRESEQGSAGPQGQSTSLQSGVEGGSEGERAGITPKPGTPLRSSNALIPFTAVIMVTCVGMIFDGVSKIQEGGNQVPATLVNVLSSCDSVSVLIWASAVGWLTSLSLVCAQEVLSLPEAMETWMEGMKVPIIIISTLSLGRRPGWGFHHLGDRLRSSSLHTYHPLLAEMVLGALRERLLEHEGELVA